MDFYKKIIRNPKVRKKMIYAFDFIPDETMLKIQYFIKIHKRLNLDNPRRWTEKCQWYKLNYRTPLMIKCVDKYLVREYVAEKGYAHLLNDLLWVGDTLEGLDLSSLPDRFVIKLNSGSGTNIIVKNKSDFDLEAAIQTTNEWIEDSRHKPLGREWAYYDVPPKLIIEKYLEESKHGLTDYKFFCFNGEISNLFVISDRFTSEKLDLYSPDWKRLDVILYVCPNQSKTDLPKPENYEKMLKIAKDLSRDFPHVRVDLYNINGRIYFGELTFFSGSGYYVFKPDAFDFWLGEKFILPSPIK